jgi:hypothetical protein
MVGPEPRTDRDRCSIKGCRRVLVAELEGGTLTSSVAGSHLVPSTALLREGVERDRVGNGDRRHAVGS